MSEQERERDSQSPELAIKLRQMIESKWISQATYVAAELRIPDLLAGGPRSTDEIARATECPVPSLRRLLRALVTLDLCREQEDGAFALTPLGSLLRSDGEPSLARLGDLRGQVSMAHLGQPAPQRPNGGERSQTAHGQRRLRVSGARSGAGRRLPPGDGRTHPVHRPRSGAHV